LHSNFFLYYLDAISAIRCGKGRAKRLGRATCHVGPPFLGHVLSAIYKSIIKLSRLTHNKSIRALREITNETI
jgi:hypothetical protein